MNTGPATGPSSKRQSDHCDDTPLSFPRGHQRAPLPAERRTNSQPRILPVRPSCQMQVGCARFRAPPGANGERIQIFARQSQSVLGGPGFGHCRDDAIQRCRDGLGNGSALCLARKMPVAVTPTAATPSQRQQCDHELARFSGHSGETSRISVCIDPVRSAMPSTRPAVRAIDRGGHDQVRCIEREGIMRSLTLTWPCPGSPPPRPPSSPLPDRPDNGMTAPAVRRPARTAAGCRWEC